MRLQVYNVVHSMNWNISWPAVLEVEAVLNISRITTTLVQYEHLFNGAYGNLISALTLNSYRSQTLNIIDQTAMTASPHLPRIARQHEALTEIGKVINTLVLIRNK